MESGSLSRGHPLPQPCVPTHTSVLPGRMDAFRAMSSAPGHDVICSNGASRTGTKALHDQRIKYDHLISEAT